MTFREWRHNPCLMRPLSAVMLIVLMLLSAVALILKFPALIIGLMLQPMAARFNWIVEFLYPMGVGRWVHFFILRMAGRSRKSKPNDKCFGYHSRTIESRFEVVKDRVYVHPLPQLIDNLGYLVVSLPEGKGNIVGFVVDCGDADAVIRQAALISKFHYKQKKIHIQSILSTHKHHDHTAGNKSLFHSKEFGDELKLVFGGAVEKVPECNYLLENGEKLPLPRDGGNDMSAFVEVEAIATPGHTRGSLSYALRPSSSETSSFATLVFTGDTMFSAGGGVPFESDMDANQDSKASRMTGDSFIKASAATHAVERCLAEILFRSVPASSMPNITSDEVVILPGHEYSYELLNRQLTQPNESCKWKAFSPNVFFETVSHFYVAMHRRQLPTSSGNLLVAPSPLSRELTINPNLRSLKKRADIILSAVRLWNHHFAESPVGNHIHGAFGINGALDKKRNSTLVKSKSNTRQWNLDAQDLNAPVFTTVYASDLDKVIEDLDSGIIAPHIAAERLRQLKNLLDVPAIGRRPIPSTLPSDRVIYKGLLGLALLGSSPSALTFSDSQEMKLPEPIGNSSDLIVVSKKRLIAVLYWLGLLTEENEGKRTVEMIERLWSAAKEHEAILNPPDTESTQSAARYDSVDVESSSAEESDCVDLGALKWILYGLPSTRTSSRLPSFCMPCSAPKSSPADQEHPIETCNMKQEHGELVRHDIFSCPICKSAAGNPGALETEEAGAGAGASKTRLLIGTSEDSDSAADDDDESGYVEVTPEGLGALLREA